MKNWMKQSEKLKPCPFCECGDVSGRLDGEYRYFVHCRKCGGSGPAAESEVDAIKTWNALRVDGYNSTEFNWRSLRTSWGPQGHTSV